MQRFRRSEQSPSDPAVQRRFAAVLGEPGDVEIDESDLAVDHTARADDVESRAEDGEALDERRPPGTTRVFGRGQLVAVAVLGAIALLVTVGAVLRARPVALAQGSDQAAPTVSVSTPSAAGSAATLDATASAGPSGPATPTGTPVASPSGAGATIVVHVAGAVRQPGVVTLASGARVADALRKAGGPTAHAELGELNLAQVLGDGQQVLIATRAAAHGDPPEVSAVRDPGTSGSSGLPGTGTSGSAPANGPVNLNTATTEQLDELPGVGPVTAGAILAWREQNGRFSTVAELQEVDGIGPKTYADLAPLVTV